MHNVFLNSFGSIDDVIRQFEIHPRELDGISWIFASYGAESYQGDAFVLFEKDKKLYQVNGSHCSCNGLEGQWSPEETTLEVIGHLLNEGTLGTDDYSGNVFKNDLQAFLAERILLNEESNNI